MVLVATLDGVVANGARVLVQSKSSTPAELLSVQPKCLQARELLLVAGGVVHGQLLCPQLTRLCEVAEQRSRVSNVGHLQTLARVQHSQHSRAASSDRLIQSLNLIHLIREQLQGFSRVLSSLHEGGAELTVHISNTELPRLAGLLGGHNAPR